MPVSCYCCVAVVSVMEYCPGGTLQDGIYVKDGQLTARGLRNVRRIISDVFECLSDVQAAVGRGRGG